MNDKEQLVDTVIDLMDQDEMSLTDRLEVVANILIREGLYTIPEEFLPEKVTPINLMETVLDLKERYQETLGMAMIHQGLVLLMWLENSEK